MFATAITHPFEIIRAKLQTMGLSEQSEGLKQSDRLISQHLRRLREEGGWFVGLAPRLIKKPIANMLTFLLFEILEDSRRGEKQ